MGSLAHPYDTHTILQDELYPDRRVNQPNQIGHGYHTVVSFHTK